MRIRNIKKQFIPGVPKLWAAKSSERAAKSLERAAKSSERAAKSSERAARLFSKAVIGGSFSEKIKFIIKISFFISNLNFSVPLKRFNDFSIHKNVNL